MKNISSNKRGNIEQASSVDLSMNTAFWDDIGGVAQDVKVLRGKKKDRLCLFNRQTLARIEREKRNLEDNFHIGRKVMGGLLGASAGVAAGAAAVFFFPGLDFSAIVAGGAAGVLGGVSLLGKLFL